MFYKLQACECWWLKTTTINVLITNISDTVTGKTCDVHLLHQDQRSHILWHQSVRSVRIAGERAPRDIDVHGRGVELELPVRTHTFDATSVCVRDQIKYLLYSFFAFLDVMLQALNFLLFSTSVLPYQPFKLSLFCFVSAFFVSLTWGMG